VLEEGEVQAGDEIVKVADGPERLTVAQVDGLLYLPGHPRALLERALRVPALSAGWQESFRALLAKADGRAAAGPAWPGFRPLGVAEIRLESASVTSFRLVPIDDTAPAPSAMAGQYLTVRVRPDENAPPLVRSYSVSDLPDEHGYRISVKREGPGSRYMHEHVKVGDLIDVAAPRGSFVVREGERPVVLISAGVGVTPVLAMLHALAREHSARPIWWLHGARNGAEHPFRDEAEALLAGLSERTPVRRLQPADRTPTSTTATTICRAGSTWLPSRQLGSRATRTTTCADPRASCAKSAPGSPRGAYCPSAWPPRRSARRRFAPRASSARGNGRRTRLTVHPEPDRPSRSCAAA
jgi:ferredoxin-NADP reductase